MSVESFPRLNLPTLQTGDRQHKVSSLGAWPSKSGTMRETYAVTGVQRQDEVYTAACAVVGMPRWHHYHGRGRSGWEKYLAINLPFLQCNTDPQLLLAWFLRPLSNDPCRLPSPRTTITPKREHGFCPQPRHPSTYLPNANHPFLGTNSNFIIGCPYSLAASLRRERSGVPTHPALDDDDPRARGVSYLRATSATST